jgi:hypothetical protein
MTVSDSILAIGCVLVLAATAPANGQERIPKCPNLEVLSIDFKPESGRDFAVNFAPAVKVLDSRAGERTLTVLAYGPILGSMDSSNVNTNISCTKEGFELTATIIRSVNYHGDVMQNVLWRPVVTLRVRCDSPKVVFESIWKMELSDGKRVDRARTPPYPEQQYPITVPKTLRSASDDK